MRVWITDVWKSQQMIFFTKILKKLDESKLENATEEKEELF